MSKLEGQTCHCRTLPEAIYLESEPDGFVAALIELSVGNWVKLFRCPVCNQLWRADEWDKYQRPFAVKIADIESWETYEASPFEKQLLLQSRGGVSDKSCQWAHCSKPAVKGVAFCVDHLYEIGARE